MKPEQIEFRGRYMPYVIHDGCILHPEAHFTPEDWQAFCEAAERPDWAEPDLLEINALEARDACRKVYAKHRADFDRNDILTNDALGDYDLDMGLTPEQEAQLAQRRLVDLQHVMETLRNWNGGLVRPVWQAVTEGGRAYWATTPKAKDVRQREVHAKAAAESDREFFAELDAAFDQDDAQGPLS